MIDIENITDENCDEILIKAVAINDQKAVKQCLWFGVKFEASYAAFETACKNSWLPIVKDLLRYEMCEGDEESFKEIRLCGLKSGAAADSVEVVRYLMEGNGLYALRERDSFMVLKSAAFNGAMNVVRYLSEEYGMVANQDMRYLLTLTAEYNQLEVIKYLVSLGVEINNGDGDAARISAELPDSTLLQYLLSVGVNKKGKEGALLEAVRHGVLSSVQLLVNAGVNLDVYNGEPLRLSVQKRRRSISQFLIQSGANINLALENSGGVSPEQWLKECTWLQDYARSLKEQKMIMPEATPDVRVKRRI